MLVSLCFTSLFFPFVISMYTPVAKRGNMKLIHPFFAAESDISTTDSLVYDFKTIEAATNKFSTSNKLGEGGFGAVYMVRRSLFPIFLKFILVMEITNDVCFIQSYVG